MASSKRIKELYDWLGENKIQFGVIDKDVIDIPEFGKVFFQDTCKSSYKSIFRKDRDGNIVFNSMEVPEILMQDEIYYIAFKFGDNFYYTDLREPFSLNILKFVGMREDPVRQEKFVNLGVHTPNELLNGSFLTDKWVKKAKYLRHEALGICDYNTMGACFQLQKDCEKGEIKPIFGYSLTVEDEDKTFDGKVYVQTQQGYQNLLRIQKAIMVDNVEHGTISIEELLNRAEGNAFVFGSLSVDYMIEKPTSVEDIVDAFDRTYYQVDLSEYKAERIDIEYLKAVKKYYHELYENHDTPRPILISDCYYLDKDNAKNKIILNKIAEGAAHNQSDDQYFKDIDEHFAHFQHLFSDKWDIDRLFKECCDNTMVIADHAEAVIHTDKIYMPKYDMTAEEKAKYGTTRNMFNELLEEGLQRLTPPDKIDIYRKQMEYEKYIIESTDNVDYLLVQYDTVNWARSNDILVGPGRGSAAGSILLYLLGITLMDPIKYDLIFERFLLPERAGLYKTDTTIIGEDIQSNDYFELELEDGKIIKVDKDAEFMVNREGEESPIFVYGDELKSGDDIIFDNRDLIFTLNEL